MTHFIWQFNWKFWYLPWHSKTEDDYYKGVYHNFAGIGPFQFKWYSSR